MFIRFILTAIPFIWVVGMIPFVNKVYPLVLGLPFLAAWLASGCLVSFACLYTLYQIHGKHQRKEEN